MATTRLSPRPNHLVLAGFCTALLTLMPQAYAKNKDSDSSSSTTTTAEQMFGMMPPYINTTITMGKVVKSAEKSMMDWQNFKSLEMVGYDVYTEKKSDSEYLEDYQKFCGKDAKSCLLNSDNKGDNLKASSFISPLAYEKQEMADAAVAYIRNITNPQPFEYPGDKAAFKKGKDGRAAQGELTDDGKKYFLGVYKALPMMTMVQNSLLAIYNDRQRYPFEGVQLPIGKDNQASMMEILNYEATRRYTNPGWYDEMNKLSTEALLREIANMQAFNTYLEVKRYEQMSRIEALMATQVAAVAQYNQSGAQQLQKSEETDVTGDIGAGLGVQ